MDNLGVVKSAEWNESTFIIKFKKPDSNVNTQRLCESEVDNLFKYLNINNKTQILDMKIPLIQDLKKEWYIHIPSNYTRGSKYKFKSYRYSMNNGILEWFNRYPVRSKRVCSGPLMDYRGKYPYYFSKKFVNSLFIVSFILSVFSFMMAVQMAQLQSIIGLFIVGVIFIFSLFWTTFSLQFFVENVIDFAFPS